MKYVQPNLRREIQHLFSELDFLVPAKACATVTLTTITESPYNFKG